VPADFGAWVGEIIDPPRAVQPGIPNTSTEPERTERNPLPRRPTSAPSRPSAQVSVTSEPLTPAMAALFDASAQRDPLGDAVRWVAAQSPSAEAWLDEHCPTGRFGPVPLGIAAAGAVALVAAIATLYLLAAVIAMLVVVIYVVPRIVGRLSGEADQQRRVVRASGPADLRSFASGGELVAADQAAFRLTPEQYARLESRARALAAHHTLDRVTVSYLPTSRTLLDVRDADGTVLIRHPEYAGEPGDVLAFPAEPAAPEPAAPELAPTVSRIGDALTMTFPVPPALRAALQAGRRQANLWLVGVLAYGIVMLLSSQISSSPAFSWS
jgi:hypothetical protein